MLLSIAQAGLSWKNLVGVVSTSSARTQTVSDEMILFVRVSESEAQMRYVLAAPSRSALVSPGPATGIMQLSTMMGWRSNEFSASGAGWRLGKCWSTTFTIRRSTSRVTAECLTVVWSTGGSTMRTRCSDGSSRAWATSAVARLFMAASNGCASVEGGPAGGLSATCGCGVAQAHSRAAVAVTITRSQPGLLGTAAVAQGCLLGIGKVLS